MTPHPMLTATARRVHGSRHEVLIDGRHVIVTDEPCRLGGTDMGPAPHELLPASLAACIATTLEHYAERKGWDIGDVEVDVAYDPRSVPRNLSVTVRLADDLEPEQLVRLERVAASCPVHRSLEVGFAYEQRLEGVPRADSREVA